MSNPYNEALGATLIERSFRERIVLVGVTFPGSTEADTEASLDELAALIDTAGADEVGRLIQPRDRPDHTWFIGKGKAQEGETVEESMDDDSSDESGVEDQVRSPCAHRHNFTRNPANMSA